MKVDTQKDERVELVKRARAEDVDRRIMSADEVSAIVANLNQLGSRGLYKDALAYHDLGSLQIAAAWNWMPDQSTQTICARDPNGTPAPFPDPKTLLPAGDNITASRLSNGTHRFLRRKATRCSRRCRPSNRRRYTR